LRDGSVLFFFFLCGHVVFLGPSTLVLFVFLSFFQVLSQCRSPRPPSIFFSSQVLRFSCPARQSARDSLTTYLYDGPLVTYHTLPPSRNGCACPIFNVVCELHRFLFLFGLASLPLVPETLNTTPPSSDYGRLSPSPRNPILNFYLRTYGEGPFLYRAFAASLFLFSCLGGRFHQGSQMRHFPLDPSQHAQHSRPPFFLGSRPFPLFNCDKIHLRQLLPKASLTRRDVFSNFKFFEGPFSFSPRFVPPRRGIFLGWL